MRKTLVWIGFCLLLVVLAGFVRVTSQGLPATVATHFALDGTANGFTAQAWYSASMQLLVLALPLLLAVLPAWQARHGGRGLNIPHRAYWLAPARREQTAATLACRGKVFAAVLALFLTYVHWLLLTANRQLPARLPPHNVFIALALFLAALAVWSYALRVRFRRSASSIE